MRLLSSFFESFLLSILLSAFEFPIISLKYPLYKKFDYTDNTIWVDGKGINIYPTLDTQKILREIKEEKIDVVIDCSKFYISKKTLQKYIDAGAKNAIASDEFGSLLHRVLEEKGNMNIINDFICTMKS